MDIIGLQLPDSRKDCYKYPEHPYIKLILEKYNRYKKNIKTDKLLREVIETFMSAQPEEKINSDLEIFLAKLNDVEDFLDEERGIIKKTTLADLEKLTYKSN